MQLPYFYHESPADSGSVTLSEETSKHIVQVLRMKEEDQLQLTNGEGQLLTVKIASAHKKHTVVEVLEKEQFPSQHRPTIAISILKNTSRLEWFMEKATELGVGMIAPLQCTRTEKSAFRYDRMKAILISAMLQSRQTFLPKLAEPVKFEQYLQTIGEVEAGYIAHCYEGEKIYFKDAASLNSGTILIGPEGDFTPEEVALAQEKGFVAVSLGDNRLRTETAAVAAAVLMCL